MSRRRAPQWASIAARAAVTRAAIGTAAIGTALGAACTLEPARSETGAGPPERIVSQIVLADEVLWDLGPETRTRVVGVSKLADDGRYSGVVERWPASVPRLGGSGEAMLTARPQLVIVGSFTSQDVRALLAGAGVETLVVDRLSGYDDYRHNVRTIAAAVGAEAQGAAVLARFEARLEEIEQIEREGGAAGEGAVEHPTVLSWTEGIVGGTGTTFDDAARTAGLDNVAHELRGHRRVTLEQLVLWDPEILIVPCDPGRCEAAAADLAGRLGIRDTRAGRSGGVHAIPQHMLSSTGAGMLDLAEELARIRAGAERSPVPGDTSR